MNIKRDPVEQTEEYKEAMLYIEDSLERECPEQGLGTCHRYWALKKEKLAQHGIDWHSPAELNPDIRFD